MPRALVSGDTRGIVKMVAETASGKVLGLHSVSRFAGELMGEAVTAVRFGLTTRDIAGTVHRSHLDGESQAVSAVVLTVVSFVAVAVALQTA